MPYQREENSCLLVILICISLIAYEHLSTGLFIILLFSGNCPIVFFAQFLYRVLFLFYWLAAALHILWVVILCDLYNNLHQPRYCLIWLCELTGHSSEVSCSVFRVLAVEELLRRESSKDLISQKLPHRVAVGVTGPGRSSGGWVGAAGLSVNVSTHALNLI